MKKIVFRGKRKDTNEFAYGCLLTNTDPLIKEKTTPYILVFDIWDEIKEGSTIFEVIPDTVGQSTGLFDKIGNKIFEGDIVAYEDAEADYEGYHDNVFMNRGEVVLSAQNGIGFTNRQTVEMDDLFIDEIMIDCKVIGNIHDNPELLEVL